MNTSKAIEIRLCETVEMFEGCVNLQHRVFDIPEIEISPIRHFIVTMHAGGFILGAFLENKMIGFCLSVPAYLDGERAFYSHMTAVDRKYQCHGIGSRLKWKQREFALQRGVTQIKWTFQPEKALNAYFNLEKLGAEVREYMPNFYGTDYATLPDESDIEIQSDRLFAVWDLNSEKTKRLFAGESFENSVEPAAFVEITSDWNELLRTDKAGAAREQKRIRGDFQRHFSKGLVCTGFRKDKDHSGYELFDRNTDA